jgi:cobalt-zinc-cadmium efflux system outer membrane protein
MSRVHPCAAGLCAGAAILLSGCAAPLVDAWNDPLYRLVIDEPEGAAPAPAASADAPAAPAAEQPGRLTIADAVRIGITSHPELRRAGYGVRAAGGREAQAGRYPNPSIGFEIEALGSDAGRGGETTLLFEQEFPTAGKRRKARDVAEADRLIEQAAFRATAFEVATRVRIVFVRALAAERRLEAFESLATLADEVLAAAEARVAAGAATETDRLRAQVVQEQARLDAATARADADAARRALAAAMGLETTLESDLAGDLASPPVLPDQEETVALALDRNAEIERARFAIERAIRAHMLAKSQATPNIVAGIGPRYSDPDNETTLDVGVGIEIPLFDRNRGEIAARMAERIGAGAALSATRLRLIEAVAEAWASYRTARLSADAYGGSLLPKAERTLDLTEQAYRAGKADYLRLLDAQQTLVRSRVAHLDALAALHEAAATLEGLTQHTTPWADALGPNTSEVTE